jgi:hypothetical protein
MNEAYRRSACDGKQRFADRSLAAKAANRKPGRKVYHCVFCAGWHVGTADHKATLIGKGKR